MHIPAQAARSITSLFLVLLLGLTAACSGSIPPLADAPAEPPQYRMVAGDQMRITILDEEALSGQHTVTSEGDISFPLLGDIVAAGKTVGEFRSELVQRLSPDYLVDPRISIEILNYRPVYVLGEVERAGEFKYAPELTVTQAVALAGGYTYRADRSRVFVRRAGQPQEVTYELSSERPVYLSPGDTIRVGERYF
jgi:polysaccharide export outer membrane protein